MTWDEWMTVKKGDYVSVKDPFYGQYFYGTVDVVDSFGVIVRDANDKTYQFNRNYRFIKLADSGLLVKPAFQCSSFIFDIPRKNLAVDGCLIDRKGYIISQTRIVGDNETEEELMREALADCWRKYNLFMKRGKENV